LNKKLRIGIVGCGQIADAHLQEIAKLKSAQVVAVCDQIGDLARQAAERFGVAGRFTDTAAMLEQAKPDVVHITTPPHTHAPIAIQLLAAGCHVYVEKPFTVDAAEADEVLDAAARAGKLVCVGHDHLFDRTWREVKDAIECGRIGRVVHVDSVMGYNLAGPYGRLMASDASHWVHRLPGGLIQNNLSHAVYKVAEFLKDERPAVSAEWFNSRASFPTELRATLRGEDVSANIVFSSLARPVKRLARIYGTRGTVEVDLDGALARWSKAGSLPGPFAKIGMPFAHFAEAGATTARNVWRFIRSDLQYFGGMNRLFSDFYHAIQNDQQPPIAASEIRRVTVIMDDIFAACRNRESHCQTKVGAT